MNQIVYIFHHFRADGLVTIKAYYGESAPVEMAKRMEEEFRSKGFEIGEMDPSENFSYRFCYNVNQQMEGCVQVIKEVLQ